MFYAIFSKYWWFQTKRITGLLVLLQLYKEKPFGQFLIFTIYQNYTFAITPFLFSNLWFLDIFFPVFLYLGKVWHNVLSWCRAPRSPGRWRGRGWNRSWFSCVRRSHTALDRAPTQSMTTNRHPLWRKHNEGKSYFGQLSNTRPVYKGANRILKAILDHNLLPDWVCVFTSIATTMGLFTQERIMFWKSFAF